MSDKPDASGVTPAARPDRERHVIEVRICPERPYQALVSLRGVEGRVSFLEEGIVRVTLDPTGAFGQYATPVSPSHAARIQAQPDDSEAYSHPAVSVLDEGDAVAISAGETSVLLDRVDGRMALRRRGRVVMREASPARVGEGRSTQVLRMAEGERFFGGGTQNGRVEHSGHVVRIVTTPMNSNQWGDGGVASPSPLVWSSAGYGVLRSTFAPGAYDFGSAGDELVATHEDGILDAYLLVADDPGSGLRRVAQDVLRAYFKVSGEPALLPDFAFYLGHLNAYNRDAWSHEPEEGAQA